MNAMWSVQIELVLCRIWSSGRKAACMHSTTSQDMHVKQNVSSLPFTWFREMDLLRTRSWHLNECRPKRTHLGVMMHACVPLAEAKSFYKKLAPALHTYSTYLWMYGYKQSMDACIWCMCVSVRCRLRVWDLSLSRAAQIRMTCGCKQHVSQ